MPMASAVDVFVVSPSAKPNRFPLMLVPVEVEMADTVSAPEFRMTLVVFV